MYKICVYIPESHLESVKNSLFKSGAGTLGKYSHCAWQVLGKGQFMPLAGNKAFIGTENEVEKVNEYLVEMICEDVFIDAAISALKTSHPYETPAYQIIRIEDK
jgi:structural hemagglutinin/hemolysin toxin protein RtxA